MLLCNYDYLEEYSSTIKMQIQECLGLSDLIISLGLTSRVEALARWWLLLHTGTTRGGSVNANTSGDSGEGGAEWAHMLTHTSYHGCCSSSGKRGIL